MFSYTVRPASSLASWNTMPMDRRSGGDLPPAQRSSVWPSDLDLALGGPLVPVEQAQQRGLARPAGPREHDELARSIRERDVGERGILAGPIPKTLPTCRKLESWQTGDIILGSAS